MVLNSNQFKQKMGGPQDSRVRRRELEEISYLINPWRYLLKEIRGMAAERAAKQHGDDRMSSGGCRAGASRLLFGFGFYLRG